MLRRIFISKTPTFFKTRNYINEDGTGETEFMDKQTADSLIIKYNKKLFGFALSKTCSIQKAEEPTSSIVLDGYNSLLKEFSSSRPKCRNKLSS
jgi:hypothetical protein